MERGTVRYAARSTSLRKVGAWIPSKSPIPEGSIAHRLRAEGRNYTDTGEIPQDIWFQNWEKGLDLWEICRHHVRFDTTLSLIWFQADDLPEVEFDRFGTRVVDDGGLPELTGELPWPGRRKRK